MAKVVQLQDKDGDLIYPAIAKEQILDLFYPVGSFYTSASLSTATAVGNALGGTWTKITDYKLVAYAALTASTTIGVSKNISSVTCPATGTFQVNFSKNMANTNYVAFVTGEVGGTGNEVIGVYGKTTSNFKYDFTSISGSATTPTQVNIAVFGELATPEYYTYKRTA